MDHTMESVNSLYQQLAQQLEQIETEKTDVLEIAKLSYQAVEASMIKLKAFITAYTFKESSEEVYFFKELKPKFYSRLIYYIRLFEIETNKPDGAESARKKYLKKQLSAIKKYTEDNQHFYKYYRSAAVYMDETYFTRNKFDLLIGFDTSYFDYDQSFCTSHDYKVAMLLANEQLATYLNKALLQPDGSYADNKTAMLEELGLNWTESKAAIVEFVYALSSVGAFYNSKTKEKADVKDIARFFEIALNINLGNIYRVFYDIRLRKKEPTVFINKIQQGLSKWINELDE
jgi:hypothetical protein